MSENTLPSAPFQPNPRPRERKLDWPVVATRLHPQERTSLESAARKAGLKKSEYIRSRLVTAVLADLAA